MASLSYLDHAAELFRALFQSREVEKFMHTVATRLFLLLLLLLPPRLMFLIYRWHKKQHTRVDCMETYLQVCIRLKQPPVSGTKQSPSMKLFPS